jgi:hypothetical protein
MATQEKQKKQSKLKVRLNSVCEQFTAYLLDIHPLIVAHKRGPLFIRKGDTSAPGLRTKPVGTFDDPEKRNDRKYECGPMNERVSRLVGKDGPKGPRNRDRCRKVTLGRGECVSGGSSFEE